VEVPQDVPGAGLTARVTFDSGPLRGRLTASSALELRR
jgi:hypothetical protein